MGLKVWNWNANFVWKYSGNLKEFEGMLLE